MNTVNMNQFFPVKSFSNIMDDIMNRGFHEFVGSDHRNHIPSVNIRETDENYVIEMAVPGFEKSDFNIRVENDQLIISADKKLETEKTEGKWVRKEFNYNQFSRSFTVSKFADMDNILAEYNHGVLQLSIAKKEEAKVKPAKLIEIK
ncbi:MAG: Hsp20/alpha crystallin family protein [Saprospiraceae bacterium]